MMVAAFLARMWRPVLIGLLLIPNYIAVRNFVWLSSDLLQGDESANQLAPRPMIHPLRVPVRPITTSRQAVDRIGSDFAQVYFPAQDITHLQDAYDPARTLDPWKRPSRYAPMVILACAATFCNLDFGYATLLEMLFQTLLFYGILFWAFSVLGIRKYFVFSLLLVNLCLFATPAGLSWFERGQFSLYLASGYAVLLVGLIRRRPLLIVAAAALAFVKWTSFPAVFVILAVYFSGFRTPDDLRSRGILVGIFPLTILVLLVVPALFAQGTLGFLQGLLAQELGAVPKGISLLRVEPIWVVKLVPLAAILVGAVSARLEREQSNYLIPFAAGAVILMVIYPTLAYDYGLPSVLGLLPPLVFWVRDSGAGPQVARAMPLILFLGWVIAASFSTRLFPSLRLVIMSYVVVSGVLMPFPIAFDMWNRRGYRPAYP